MSALGQPPSPAELEVRYAALAERLKGMDPSESKAEVKGEIIALFRDVDALHERAGDLRERMRALVHAYKASHGAQADRPARRQVYSDGLNSSSYVARAWNCMAAEEPAEAVAALEKALSLSPDNLEAEGLLGWALIQCGRYDPALRSLQRVLSAEPGNEMARVNLGLLCLKKGIHGEAFEHLSRVLELGGDRKARIYALHYLGLLHAERGAVEEALACFRRAIEEGPHLSEAAYHLGLLLYRQGRTDEARGVWRDAVARNRYNAYSKKAQALLEDLESGRTIVAS